MKRLISGMNVVKQVVGWLGTLVVEGTDDGLAIEAYADCGSQLIQKVVAKSTPVNLASYTVCSLAVPR